MHYDVKISGVRIRKHDLWIRKRVCYSLHHSAPTHHSAPSSAHLLVEPRWTTSCFSWLPICRTTNLELYQITSNLLPLFPRLDPNSKLASLLQLVNNWSPSIVNSPRLWFDVIYSILRALQILNITLYVIITEYANYCLKYIMWCRRWLYCMTRWLMKYWTLVKSNCFLVGL